MRDQLMSLPRTIREIHEFEVGDNFAAGPDDYHLALYSSFETLADLEVYRVHPAHQAVLEYIKANTSHITRVDYEI